MTDTIVLLALSQIICLAAIAYLHARLSSLQREFATVRGPRPAAAAVRQHGRPSRLAAVQLPPNADLAALAARMHDLGLDVPALARRMHRSEAEVRSLLRRNGVEA